MSVGMGGLCARFGRRAGRGTRLPKVPIKRVPRTLHPNRVSPQIRCRTELSDQIVYQIVKVENSLPDLLRSKYTPRDFSKARIYFLKVAQIVYH